MANNYITSYYGIYCSGRNTIEPLGDSNRLLRRVSEHNRPNMRYCSIPFSNTLDCTSKQNHPNDDIVTLRLNFPVPNLFEIRKFQQHSKLECNFMVLAKDNCLKKHCSSNPSLHPSQSRIKAHAKLKLKFWNKLYKNWNVWLIHHIFYLYTILFIRK